MYGWIEIDENNLIKKISVKKKKNHHPHCNRTFTFKNKNIFIKSYDQLVMKKDKVKNEYYVDSMINHSLKIGYKCLLLEVDNFISWEHQMNIIHFNIGNLVFISGSIIHIY